MPEHDEDYLYHYTTPRGIVGIVQKKIIWATSIFYLNDTKEFQHGMELITRHLHDLHDHAEGNQSRFDDMIGVVKESAQSKDKPIYVCSFSERADDLSQWRAYCPGGGFAIGFPKNKLCQIAEEHRYAFASCIYDRRGKVEEIKAAVELVLGKGAQKNLWPARIHGRYVPTAQTAVVLFSLQRTAARLKHNSFSSEKEWRMMCFTSTADAERQLRFRSKDGIIIPYIRCSLKSKEMSQTEDLWKAVRIFVGPTLDPKASKASVEQLLRVYCPARGGWTVKLTSVPYRRR